MTLALWVVPYEQPRQDGASKFMCVHPLLVYYLKMGSDTFLSKN